MHQLSGHRDTIKHLPQFGCDRAINAGPITDGERVMLGAMMLMAQSIPAAPPPQPVAGPNLPPQIAKVAASCAKSGDDIVVCGKSDQEQYRLRPLGPPPNSRIMPPATIPIGKGTADLRGVQRSVPPGGSAPAAMVTLKLPF